MLVFLQHCYQLQHHHHQRVGHDDVNDKAIEWATRGMQNIKIPLPFWKMRVTRGKRGVDDVTREVCSLPPPPSDYMRLFLIHSNAQIFTDA
jgi:hypothetical protein